MCRNGPFIDITFFLSAYINICIMFYLQSEIFLSHSLLFSQPANANKQCNAYINSIAFFTLKFRIILINIYYTAMIKKLI